MGDTFDADDAQLAEFAALIRERNSIDARIGAILNRPATVGDIGEWIAAKVFDIELAAAANNTAFDGHFTTGSLAGRTVNVKTYLQQYGSLSTTEHPALDCYLVFIGPKGPLGSSRGRLRPFCIESVHLFDARTLVAEVKQNGGKIGNETGIRVAQWNTAEIYPRSTNTSLVLTDKQRAQLAMFQPD